MRTIAYKYCCFFCLFFTLATVFSCKKTEQAVGDRKLKVAVSLFPLYDFTKNIGKDKLEVILLTPPGIEPHGFEPKPGDIMRINNADLFVYTNKFMEPWIDDILKGLDNENLLIIDSSKGITFKEDRGKGIDPHIWLDIQNAITIVDNIRDGLVKKDPSNSITYITNAEEFKKRLFELDIKFQQGLSNCKTDTIIHAGHFAFGYLSDRYNLKYITVYKGFSPDAEPNPKLLAELIKELRRHDSRYLYHEELIMPRLAEAISKETGVKLLRLHGGHNISKEEMKQGIDFITIMEENLQNLRTGLQCQ